MLDDTEVEGYCPSPFRPPKHRADCNEFYCESIEKESLFFRGPNAVFHAIEEASERAGRTCNAQMIYLIKLCRGEQLPLADDERTEEEWRSLLSRLEICLNEGEAWRPCSVILKKPRLVPQTA
jgi:hypothetical protein